MNVQDLEKCNIECKNPIRLLNPLSEEFNIMRPSMLPSILTVTAFNNAQKNTNVKLFDISRTYDDVKQNIEKGQLRRRA